MVVGETTTQERLRLLQKDATAVGQETAQTAVRSLQTARFARIRGMTDSSFRTRLMFDNTDEEGIFHAMAEIAFRREFDRLTKREEEEV